MEEARGTTDEGGQAGVRVDWRTGRPMVRHDDAFWREQERRRVELGMNVPQYCAANGLALSTYRHRVNGLKRKSTKASAPTSAAARSPSFIAVAPPHAEAAAIIEVTLEGMTMRLCGAAAERVLARVMDRLA